MRLRTAAAKRGLGLMASGIGGLMRRFSTLAETDVVKKKKKKDMNLLWKAEPKMNLLWKGEPMIKRKTLYLCFSELHCYKSACYASQVVRPIRLDEYDDIEEEEHLDEAAYRKRFKYNKCHCTTFGSHIVFPVGPDNRNLCSIDTTPSIKFSPTSAPSNKGLDKTENIGAHHKLVRLGDIDGKLYRFDNNRRGHFCHSYFEVLDLAAGGKGQTLSRPPFILSRDYNVAFLEASKKILGWELEVSGVFFFDTTKPECGWTAVPPALGDTLPFLNHTFDTPFYDTRKLWDTPRDVRDIIKLDLPETFYNTPLFIHNYHPDVGDFHLYFHYDPKNEPLSLSPFFLSSDFVSFQAISKPIQLPISCIEYFPLFPSDEYYKHVNSDFEFVHFGAQKVGLVINQYFGDGLCGYKGKLLLVTFEYDIISNNAEDSEPIIEIQTRMLGVRRFAYNGKRVHTHPYTPPYSHINGAFWL